MSGYEIRKKDNVNKFYEDVYSLNQTKTMIPIDLYINNLKLAETYLQNIQGDVVECGVWRGGMIAGLTKILGNNRKYFLYDSFEGLPDAREIDGADALSWQSDKNGSNYFDNCRAEMTHAEEIMNTTQVDYSIVKGWFNETLPVNECSSIALLRLDADWYESTMSILENLYPKVVKDGLIIIDDYYVWDGCSRAVHDYLSQISSTSRIKEFQGVSYLIKQDSNTKF